MKSGDSTPAISICIPAYRAEKFLPEALESIARQSFKDWELVVTEDGSRDGTEILVVDFSRSVSQPVRYQRHEKNKGLTATRNTGIRAARASHIAILDADDAWEPEHLATLHAHMESSQADVVHSGSILFDHDSRRRLEIRAPDATAVEQFPISLFRAEYIIQPSSVLLSKSLWERVGGFDESFQHVEDREMWLRSVRAGARFTFTGTNTCLYRKHGNAMSGESVPMAIASARVFERHLDWEMIPADLRKLSAAEAWISAGRLLWRKNPGQAADCFAHSCRIQFRLRWWLWGQVQSLRQWLTTGRDRSAAPAIDFAVDSRSS
jgi:glycosyltransferase involved in cell wall biosynthesis